jgi:perosamine synthetase
MDAILRIAADHNLLVIEDAAEAHGALYRGKRVGSLGKINTFSFYGNKIITTGEGGILTTDDSGLAERVRYLRDHAMSPQKRYWHTEVGFNYRMTNLQAALGVAQMERIEMFISRKRWIAQTYREGLEELPTLAFSPEALWASSVFWMSSILIKDGFPLTRDQVMARLKEQGIDSRPFFYPIHVMPPYQNPAAQLHLPVAEDLSQRGINLPSAVTLSAEDLDRIVHAIREMSN